MYNKEKSMSPTIVKNKKRLMPEIKIKANHVTKINIVWPISGWEANSPMIGIINKKLTKYLMT